MSKEEKEYRRRLKKIGKHLDALSALTSGFPASEYDKIQRELTSMNAATQRLQAVANG